MKIGAMVSYNPEDRHGGCRHSLADNLKIENFDILCCHDTTSYNRESMFNESSFLADKLGMTYSFTVVNPQADNEREKQVPSLAALTIMAGASTWMLSSGSFSLATGEKNAPSAQYAIIRKNGNAVLVINILFAGERGQLRRSQLCRLLDHPVLNNPYAAVLLCGNFIIKSKGGAAGKNKFSYIVKNGFAAGGGCTFRKRKDKEVAGGSGCMMPNIFVLEDGVDRQTMFDYTNSRLLNSPDKDAGCIVPGHTGIVFNMDISRKKRGGDQQMYRYVFCTNPWQKTSKRALGFCG